MQARAAWCSDCPERHTISACPPGATALHAKDLPGVLSYTCGACSHEAAKEWGRGRAANTPVALLRQATAPRRPPLGLWRKVHSGDDPMRYAHSQGIPCAAYVSANTSLVIRRPRGAQNDRLQGMPGTCTHCRLCLHMQAAHLHIRARTRRYLGPPRPYTSKGLACMCSARALVTLIRKRDTPRWHAGCTYPTGPTQGVVAWADGERSL